MASSSLLALATVAVLLSLHCATAATTFNVTEILVNGQQYSDFIRLLDETQQSTQIQNQLNNSREGITVFAPTNNAFSNLKDGTLNKLSSQEKVLLIQYHVTPKFYTFTTVKTASNPIRTQASSSTGPYYINITAASNGNQFNVSTGVNTVTVSNALNVTSPLAIYSIDAVLLPEDLFGNKTSSPPPSKAPTGSTTPAAASGPSAGEAETTTGSNSEFRARSIGWTGLLFVVALGMM